MPVYRRWAVGCLFSLAVQAAVQAQVQPVQISDRAGSSLALRMEFQSATDEAIWPSAGDPRSLRPLHEAWELGIYSLHGESPLRLANGERYLYREGQVSGPAPVRAEAVLSLLQVNKKWTGGFDGGELEGFVGIGGARLAMILDGQLAGQLEANRHALGAVLGLGFRHELTQNSMFEARLGLFSSNPLYLFGRHDFASGLTNEAVFAEMGVVWPRHQTVALHVGVQAIRYVPELESVGAITGSVTELRLWGPFLGIQAALD